MMSEEFGISTISVKNLAGLAMSDACPRCFWLQANLGFKAPWAIFPGVFQHLDGYTKKVTETWMKLHPGTVPPWLTQVPAGSTQLPCPHWSKFSFKDPVTGITLRGTPDERFMLPDGTVAILDYKTSSYTPKKADTLLPLYSAQLSGYAWLTENLEQRKTSVTCLVYNSPPDPKAVTPTQSEILDDGFTMRFSAISLTVDIGPWQIPALLQKAAGILNGPVPGGRCGCKNCDTVAQLLRLAGPGED
jgi:hypothetical protein